MTDHAHDKSGLCVRVRDNVYVIADEAWNDPTVLSDTDRASLAEHIEECPPCLEIVERAASETMLVRTSVRRSFTPSSVKLSALMEMVRTTPTGRTAENAESSGHDSGALRAAEMLAVIENPTATTARPTPVAQPTATPLPSTTPVSTQPPSGGGGGTTDLRDGTVGAPIRWLIGVGLAASFALLAMAVLPMLDNPATTDGGTDGPVANNDDAAETDNDGTDVPFGRPEALAEEAIAMTSSNSAFPVVFNIENGMRNELRDQFAPHLEDRFDAGLPDLSTSSPAMHLAAAEPKCMVGARHFLSFQYLCAETNGWCRLYVTKLDSSESMHRLLGVPCNTLTSSGGTSSEDDMEFWHYAERGYDIVAWDQQAMGYMLVTRQGEMPGEMDPAAFAVHVRKSETVPIAAY